jgi:hypothetical protein
MSLKRSDLLQVPLANETAKAMSESRDVQWPFAMDIECERSEINPAPGYAYKVTKVCHIVDRRSGEVGECEMPRFAAEKIVKRLNAEYWEKR